MTDYARRVVITGCGVVTNIGATLEEFWQNLCEGRNGYGPIAGFDISGYDRQVGGEVRNFRPEDTIPDFSQKSSRLGRTSQMAIAAGYSAIWDANLDAGMFRSPRAGVAIGTTDGESQCIEKMNNSIAGVSKSIDETAVRMIGPNRIGGNIAREFNISGPVNTITSACTAGNHAISLGFQRIAAGEADLMLVGGADSFSRKSFTGFCRLGAVAPEVCQPFGQDRKGMIPSEGAGIMVIETLKRALGRQAPIYAEIAGCGYSCDAHHMTQPKAEGISLAMDRALANAGIGPEAIDFICAHGTGTASNDNTEAMVINEKYGAGVPVSSIKSAIGHTMGAASALNVITVCLAIRHGKIPKNNNVTSIDAACDIDCVLETRKAPVKYGQSNGFAFGGNNGVVILKDFFADQG